MSTSRTSRCSLVPRSLKEEVLGEQVSHLERLMENGSFATLAGGARSPALRG